MPEIGTWQKRAVPQATPGKGSVRRRAGLGRGERGRSCGRSMVIAVSAVTAGVAGVALVAGIPHSPITPILPAGAGPLAPFRWAARVTGIGSISPGHQAMVTVVALMVAGATFLIGLRQAWLGAVPIWV